MLHGREPDPGERADDAADLDRRRVVAGGEADGDRDDGGDARDRRDDAHLAELHAAVVRGEAEDPGAARNHGVEHTPAVRSVGPNGERDPERRDPPDLCPEQHPQRAERSADERPREVRDAPREAGAERQEERGQSTRRVAATASSWLAWYSTPASAVRAPRAS